MTVVVLVAYQHQWPAQFAAAADELRVALGPDVADIQHIGSTSVPGLCAKPVIDIVVGVPDLASVGARVTALEQRGYRYRCEFESALPDRRYFTRAATRGPSVHVHAVRLGGLLWRQHLAFRDALRSQPALASGYGELKQLLALKHAADKAAYTAAKAPFILRVLAAQLPARN